MTANDHSKSGQMQMQLLLLEPLILFNDEIKGIFRNFIVYKKETPKQSPRPEIPPPQKKKESNKDAITKKLTD